MGGLRFAATREMLCGWRWRDLLTEFSYVRSPYGWDLYLWWFRWQFHWTRDSDDEPFWSCEACGRLIDRDHGANGYDDVVSAPYVTESGDLYCIPCGRSHDAAEREAEEWDDQDSGEFDGEPR